MKIRFDMDKACRFIDGYIFLLSDKIRNTLIMTYLCDLVQKTDITCREYSEFVEYINKKLGV